MVNELLPCVEINPPASPVATIIWLHGLGADGHDFADIVPQLNLPPELPIRFVFPHAPVRPITINNGYPMRAWYDIPSLDFGSREDEEGVRASECLVRALIEQEHSRGTPYNRMILAGFSQGGAMALHCGLRFPQQLAGVLVLSAYLPLASTLAAEASVSNKSISIFMAHGSGDTIVPVFLAQASYNLLQKAGYPVGFHSYSMSHTICAEEINDISFWLRNLLMEVKHDAKNTC